jgi:hypothetical protein
MTGKIFQRRDRTRRELLAGAGRCAALAGLAALVWLLRGRGGHAPRAGSCTNDARCAACSKLDRCILPPAQYIRRAKESADG